MKPDVYSTEGNLSLSLPSPLDKRGTVYRLCMDWLLLFILCASSYLPFIGIFQLPVGTFLPLLIFACLFLSLLFSGLFFFHKIAIWALPLCSACWCILVWNIREIFVQGFILCVNQVFSVCEEELGFSFPSYLVTNQAILHKEEYCFAFILILMFVLMEIAAWGVVRMHSSSLALLVTLPFPAAALAIDSLPSFFALIPFLATATTLLLRFRQKEYFHPYVPKRVLRISSEKSAGNTAVSLLCVSLSLFFLLWAVFPPNTYVRPAAIDDLRIQAEDFLSSLGKQAPSDLIIWNPSGQFSSSRVNLATKGNLSFSGKTVLKIRSDSPSDLYLRGFTGGTYTHSSWRVLENRAYENLSPSLERYNPLLYWGGIGTAPFTACHLEIDALDETASMLAPHTLKSLPSDAVFSFDQAFSFQVPKQEYSLSAYSASLDNIYETGPRSAMMQFLQYIAQYYDENCEGFADLFTMDADRNRSAYLQILSAGVQRSLSSEALQFLQAEMDYRQFALYQYTRIPEELSPYLDSVVETLEQNYWSIPEEDDSAYSSYTGFQPIIDAVTHYLADTCRYSLSPGTTPSGKDFTRYFLEENREGYCVHFATAAVLLFRSLGIPARYVEGYIVPLQDFTRTDSEGWVHVSDEKGHAWAEIYVPLYGWTPVEVTPGYSGASPQNPDMPYPEGEEISSSSEEESSSEPVSSSVSQEESEASSSSAPFVSSAVSDPSGNSKGGGFRIPDAVLWVVFILLLLGAVCLLRFFLMEKRRRKAMDPDRVKAILFLYKTAKQICRSTEVPAALYNLAEKAAFSRLPLTEEEYTEAFAMTESCRLRELEALPRWKRPLFRFLFGSLSRK